MANILFTAPPLVGHLNPALAVAKHLQSQGHVVAWAVHMDRVSNRMDPAMRCFDIGQFDPAGELDSTKVRGLESVRLFFEDYCVPMTRACFKPILNIIEDFKPAMLVVDHQMPAGALAAQAAGLPWVSLVTTTASILRLSDTLDEWVSAQFASLQNELLPAELHRARPDLSPHAVLVFSNQQLMGNLKQCLPAPYEFVGPTQGEGRATVAFPWDKLKTGTRKVLLTLGTVSRDRDTRFFEVFLQAFAQMPDVQAVVVAPESVAELAPANVIVSPFVPQMELLPHMDAVVCHAGHNTVCEALRFGIPLGVAPIRDDQPVIARQVIDAGAGISIRFGKVTPAAALHTLNELLDNPIYRQAAQQLATHFAHATGAQGAAQHIEHLINDTEVSTPCN
jgi:MGT family glycosyltransferase